MMTFGKYRERVMAEQARCPYCHDYWQYHKPGSIHCKPKEFMPTGSQTDFATWEIWMDGGETPCMMCFDECGRGAYIDINYCPICGRDLREA